MTHAIPEVLVFGARLPYPEPAAPADAAAAHRPTNVDASTRLLRQRIRDAERVPALTRWWRRLARPARPSRQHFQKAGGLFGRAAATARC